MCGAERGSWGHFLDKLIIWSLNLLFSSVQSLSCVRLFVTLWTTALQASLSITNYWSLLKLMSIKLVMLSKHLILCRPLLLPPSIFPSIRIFFNESTPCISWPKYWSFSFSLSPFNEYSGLISFRTDGLALFAVSRVSSNPTVAFARMSDSWTHAVCGLLRVVASATQVCNWVPTAHVFQRLDRSSLLSSDC